MEFHNYSLALPQAAALPAPFYTIKGQREGSCLYTSGEGFYFVKNRHSGTKIYLRCSKRSCHATGEIFVNTPNMIVKGVHDHPPEVLKEAKLKFAWDLKGHKTTKGLRAIYNHEASRNNIDGAAVLPFPSAYSMMKRERKKNEPEIPTTLEQLKATVDDPRWHEQYAFVYKRAMDQPTEFIIGEVVADNQFVGLMLGSRVFLNSLNTGQIDSICMDGTFKVLPKLEGLQQLFTVQAVIGETLIPLAFYLLKNKAQVTFERALVMLQDQITIPETTIISDYELALKNAIGITFPHCTNQGCWFHFNQSVLRYARSNLHLSGLLKANHYAKKTVAMIFALAHLPATAQNDLPENFTVQNGLHITVQYAQRKGVFGSMSRLFTYLQEYWIDIRGAQTFSVYNSRHRTNNFIESFHASILKSIGSMPSIWMFYDYLRKIQLQGEIQLIQIANNIKPNETKFNSRCINDATIEEAWAMVRQHGLSLYRFLKIVSTTAQGYASETINNFNGVEEEEDD